MATYNNIKKIKIGDNIFNLYDSGNSGGTITSVQTTAGAHTAVNVTSGAVSFNVPTKTSDLTNDSGFISRALLSISFTGGTNSFDYSFTTTAGIVSDSVTITPSITKAMVTTALGTGSGTTKFLREDGSWAKPAYIANTDAKLQVAEVTSATQYYPLVGTGTTAATRQYDTTGFKYKGTTGTTSAVGSAIVELGNSTASGTAGNKQAQLIMYGSNAKKATITLAAPSADIALALPTSGGTLALTSQIPTVSYPVTSVNSKTGAVSLTASDVGALASNTTYVSKITTSAGTHSAISNKSGAVSFNVPTKTSHLTNDSGFLTTETDPTVPSWAKADSKPSYTASEVGAVPTTRTVNGKALSANVADADYITEEGTSSSWNYRKWHSGKVEAWRTIDFASASWSTWASPVKYMDKTLTFPSGLFPSNGSPSVIATSCSNQYWVVGCTVTSTTQATLRIASVSSTAMATTIRFYAYNV